MDVVRLARCIQFRCSDEACDIAMVLDEWGIKSLYGGFSRQLQSTPGKSLQRRRQQAASNPLAVQGLTKAKVGFLAGYLILFAVFTVIFCDNANAQRGAISDTLDWQNYLPLLEGNQWQYHYSDADEDLYHRHSVLRDTLIDSINFHIYEIVAFDESKRIFATSVYYVRYSDLGSHIVQVFPADDGSFSDPRWWSFIPCGLDGRFGEGEIYTCAGEAQGFEVRIFGHYGGTLVLGTDTIEVNAIKEVDSVFGGYAFANGLGLIGYGGEAAGVDVTLAYAQVNGSPFGTPVVSTSVVEPRSIPEEITIEALYPHPVVDKLSVRYRVKEVQQVNVSIYNMLGQTLYTHNLGIQIAGIHTHNIDISRTRISASGIYVSVIASVDGSRAVSQFVVIH